MIKLPKHDTVSTLEEDLEALGPELFSEILEEGALAERRKSAHDKSVAQALGVGRRTRGYGKKRSPDISWESPSPKAAAARSKRASIKDKIAKKNAEKAQVDQERYTDAGRRASAFYHTSDRHQESYRPYLTLNDLIEGGDSPFKAKTLRFSYPPKMPKRAEKAFGAVDPKAAEFQRKTAELRKKLKKQAKLAPPPIPKDA